MIDPRIWAETPGQGRAPLLAPPQQPAQVTADPRADIVRLLQGATGQDNRTRPGDMPVGQLVRDPATLTQMQQFNEMEALGGFPHEGRALATRVPAATAGLVTTLAGAGGLGAPMGLMAGKGVEQHQQRLANVFTQGIAEAHERGSQARDQRDIAGDAFADAYEAGRQAAVGFRPSDRARTVTQSGGQSRDQRDISRGSRSRDTQHSIAI